jgi:YesN/AraC family two-component response regulator
MDYKKLIKYTKDLTVLYAEDEEEIALINEDFFKVLFKEVISVSNGLDAVREFEMKNFDLIILDIEIPLMNGVDISKKIREKNIKQKIIFLSAFEKEEYFKEIINLGDADFIGKPLNENEFFEKIYNLIGWEEF